MRRPLFLIATASSALVLAACGSEGVSVPEGDPNAAGAEIFATRCSGCHTISAAGTQGSGNRALRAQGPNFDQRVETYDEVLYAIRNGGFSGAIMPQNIVVGDEVATGQDTVTGGEVEQPSDEQIESGGGSGAAEQGGAQGGSGN